MGLREVFCDLVSEDSNLMPMTAKSREKREYSGFESTELEY